MFVFYGIPLFITLLLAGAVCVFWRCMYEPTDTHVEITVESGENPEMLENAIRTAVDFAARFFRNAKIYVRTKDDALAEAVCKRYGVLRKE